MAEAYFPKVKDAWGHTLKLVERELQPEEDVLAAIGCFHGATLRLGLLFITDVRLLWTKQSFLRHQPRYVTIRFEDLVNLEFEFNEKWGRPSLRPVLSDVADAQRAEIFSFDDERYGALPAFLRVLQGVLDEKLTVSLDPGDLTAHPHKGSVLHLED